MSLWDTLLNGNTCTPTCYACVAWCVGGSIEFSFTDAPGQTDLHFKSMLCRNSHRWVTECVRVCLELSRTVLIILLRSHIQQSPKPTE